MTCRSAIRFAAGGVAVLVVSGTLLAQSLERVLYVSVFDEKTRAPVTGLGPDAFSVKEDGIRREVLRVTPATTPMPVAILIDNTEGATKTIADLRRALATFLRELDGIGPVTLISVADRPTILLDYTTDQKKLQDAAGRVFAVPNSGATLLDAIVETSKGLEKREADRAAVVVVTTENTEFSNRHYQEVLEALTKGGAMMSAIVFTTPGAGNIHDDPARQRDSVLDLGPRNSGGTRVDVLTSLAYESRLQQLAALLKNQHRVVYARPQTLIPPERVEVASAKTGLEAHGGPARGQAVK
jgi:von Willebrand factor type A domain